MGYSYATVFVLVCAAIMAATPPSAAQLFPPNINVNFTGALGCRGPTGAPVPPVANATVELMCLTPSGGLGVAGAVRTQVGGIINGTAQVATNLLSQPLNLMMMCMFVAQAEACVDSVPPENTSPTLMMAPITATTGSGIPTTYTISPASPLRFPAKLYT